jgi:hypothetical protein
MISYSESSGCHEGDEKGLKRIIGQQTKNSLLPARNRNRVMFELDNQQKGAEKTMYSLTNCLDRNPVARGRLDDGTL